MIYLMKYFDNAKGIKDERLHSVLRLEDQYAKDKRTAYDHERNPY